MTCGSPQPLPVAAASTYSQRGVITATPNDLELGLTRWTRGMLSPRWFGGFRDGRTA